NLEGIGAIGLDRLMQEALRLRPDRLVIGEIRSHEAGAFIEAIMTGHGGVVATIHAGSAADAAQRLVHLARRESGLSELDLARVDLGVVTLRRGAPPVVS